METVKTELIDWAVAGSILPGQPESGDQHLVKLTPEGVLVAVVDGLGHGVEAAEAARAAVRSLERQGSQTMIALVRGCHGALAGTRGVVMSVAAFNARDETLTWVGVGNVEGLLLRAQAAVNPRRESLLLRGGVVGVHLPALSAAILPLMRGDTLIFATDGIRNDFVLAPLAQGESPKPLADYILTHWSRGIDDALVVVARWMGAGA
ncbi:MAG TPA: SpoIIE family protein phosphatase [Methylomirabilota bacterium]|nr:SpoIIE family protein phosphatase [Methylomirabilota bacterium]